jgi:CheY-like chemotaxis protein
MDINLKRAEMHGEKVDGLMISQYLKNNVLFAHIPIVLVTAYSNVAIKDDLILKSKAQGLISKPITDINNFISKLENVMLN